MEEEQLTYQQFIEQIISKRGRFGCGEEYHEKHHIIPRCLGGSNEESNMIDLYAREHFIAHKLLAKENPDNRKLQYAWWCMVHLEGGNQQRYKCTPEEYEEAKKLFSENHSRAMTGANNPNYGRHWKASIETREKLSKIHKGKPSKKKGTTSSKETRKKISEAIKGKNNPFYGKHHTEETKQRLSIPVICVETGIVYYGAKEASAKTGIDNSSISKCCKGTYQTAGGYHWKYYTEEDAV